MTPERKQQVVELRALCDRLRSYAKALDVTGRPADGEYDLTKDIYDVTELLPVLDAGCEAALCEAERLRKWLREKDAAMGVLFARLDQAGIDYSDLIP